MKLSHNIIIYMNILQSLIAQVFNNFPPIACACNLPENFAGNLILDHVMISFHWSIKVPTRENNVLEIIVKRCSKSSILRPFSFYV